VILFNNNKLKTLELYAVKWAFDTSKYDLKMLKKMDEKKLGLHD
jgi:hypothetical protein